MPRIRPFYVTDTHPFVWYLAAHEARLSPSTRSVFQNADSAKAVMVIPAIVLAESLYLAGEEVGSKPRLSPDRKKCPVQNW